MVFVNDQERFCSSTTPKLPLFSYPMNNNNRAYETTPGLATPPVNIAGSVPFQWEEAPGKPLRIKKPARSSNQRGVVRGLDLPPRLLLPGETTTSVNEPSPTTVLDGPYDLRRRSLSLPRSSAVIRKLRGVVPAPAPEKEQRLFGGGSSRWGSFGKCKDVSEGIFDFPRFRDDGCHCRKDWTGGGVAGDGGAKVKLFRIKRKEGSFFNLSHTTKSEFWARVYEGFKQVIPWKRKQEGLQRTNSSIV
ncbi:PREDICTED: uncharacterized protein At4g00950-like [Camelina sativa]|uniref:Uncharacterized protein At4g00950-like n=1 Tax=Camelina sativa TaxID=90675 RepID=A0ABM0X9I4_CAMSA|nr:PREDICTED: uncharacterized protein At4g00950-like [Camelina sativa]